MESIENPDRPSQQPPAQTIVIDRRDRGSWLGRLIGPILMFILFLLLFRGVVGTETGLPHPLDEEYVAGEITGPKIAVVEITGLIMDGQVDYALKQLRQARDDTSVRAVILRIDSPGGTVSGSDRIWREIQLLRSRDKPVVASMGGMAASGGYYAAAAADHIFAEPTTLTGSIGVILEVPEISGLLDKVGVDVQTVKTGKWKDSPSLFRPLSDEERQRWDSLIDGAYQRFVRVVAQGRKTPVSDILPLAQGQVYTAGEALKAKLVDEIGYRDDAIQYLMNKTNLESAHVIRYAEPQSVVETLFGPQSSAASRGFSLDASTLLDLQTPRMLYLAR